MKKLSIMIVIFLGVCCTTLNIYAQDTADSVDTESTEDKIQSLIENADDERLLQSLINKLDSDDALEYLKLKEEASIEALPWGNRRHHANGVDPEGIVAIICVFVLPVLIVGLVLFFRYRDNQNLYQIVNNMVDKGMEIPTHLLQLQRKKAPRSDLHKGLILISLGLGIACFLKIQGGDGWSLGIIPLFIGFAFLIIWKLESGKQKEKTIEE